jgi:hypothetical protein
LQDLVADVVAQLHVNGSWPYKLSWLHYEPAITAAVNTIAADEQTKAGACM